MTSSPDASEIITLHETTPKIESSEEEVNEIINKGKCNFKIFSKFRIFLEIKIIF